MPEYDNNNQFAFFRQGEKRNEKAPDYNSSGKYNLTLGDDLVEYIIAGGRDLDVAGWKRESAGGAQFLSCRVSVPYVKESKPEADSDF